MNRIEIEPTDETIDLYSKNESINGIITKESDNSILVSSRLFGKMIREIRIPIEKANQIKLTYIKPAKGGDSSLTSEFENNIVKGVLFKMDMTNKTNDINWEQNKNEIESQIINKLKEFISVTITEINVYLDA